MQCEMHQGETLQQAWRNSHGCGGGHGPHSKGLTPTFTVVVSYRRGKMKGDVRASNMTGETT